MAAPIYRAAVPCQCNGRYYNRAEKYMGRAVPNKHFRDEDGLTHPDCENAEIIEAEIEVKDAEEAAKAANKKAASLKKAAATRLAKIKKAAEAGQVNNLDEGDNKKDSKKNILS
jgi:hypothetical protein